MLLSAYFSYCEDGVIVGQFCPPLAVRPLCQGYGWAVLAPRFSLLLREVTDVFVVKMGLVIRYIYLSCDEVSLLCGGF